MKIRARAYFKEGVGSSEGMFFRIVVHCDAKTFSDDEVEEIRCAMRNQIDEFAKMLTVRMEDCDE